MWRRCESVSWRSISLDHSVVEAYREAALLPPKLALGFHCLTIGRLDGAVVKLRTLNTSLRLNRKPLPWKALVPDFVTQLMTRLKCGRIQRSRKNFVP